MRSVIMMMAAAWGAVAVAGEIEVFRADEVRPDAAKPRQQTPAAPARREQTAAPAPAAVKQAARALQWEPRDTNLTVPAGVPVDLQTADRAAGPADLKLDGFFLTSDHGQLAQVDRATWEGAGEATWQNRVPAHRGSNLILLRLNDGRYARIIVGTTEMDWDSAKAESPGDIAQPTAFKLVNTRYWLATDGKTESRRIEGAKLDANLVGTWKMTRPGGAMIADVPGANNTIVTHVGGWAAGDKGVLTVKADGAYVWEAPDGKAVRGRCYRIRPASPAIGRTYWAIEGLGEDGFITFDAAATHETSDGLWAGNRAEPMAIGGKRR